MPISSTRYCPPHRREVVSQVVAARLPTAAASIDAAGVPLSGPCAPLSGPGAPLSGPGAPLSGPGALLSGPGALLSGPGAPLAKPDSLLTKPGASRPAVTGSPDSGRPPVAPLRDDALWRAALAPLRSTLGKYGVVFVQLPNQCFVVKRAPDLRREVAAGQLARRVGLTVPRVYVYEARPAAALRRLVDAACGAVPAAGEAALLVMSRVDGQSFGELRAADGAALALADATGRRIMHQIGRVCALDYLIGNGDRFPCGGLGGRNHGNLMLAGAVVVCIDNTLCEPALARSANFVATYTARLRSVLALAHSATGDARSLEHVAAIVEFFPSRLGVSWERVGGSFLAGLRAGIAAVAALDRGAVVRVLAAHGGLDAPTRQFILANLDHFVAAWERPLSAAPHDAVCLGDDGGPA